MAFLAAAAPWLAAAGTAVGVAGQVSASQDAAENARLAALQAEQDANNSAAAGQRQAIDERRQAARLQSRALAVAAASGASATDPTVVTDLGQLKGEGEYRALSRLYSGDAEAENLRQQASAIRSTGKARRTAGLIGAASSVLSGATSIYDRYYAKAG